MVWPRPRGPVHSGGRSTQTEKLLGGGWEGCLRQARNRDSQMEHYRESAWGCSGRLRAMDGPHRSQVGILQQDLGASRPTSECNPKSPTARALWCTFDLPNTDSSHGGLRWTTMPAQPLWRAAFGNKSHNLGRMLAAPTWPKVPPKHRVSLSHVPNWQVEPI